MAEQLAMLNKSADDFDKKYVQTGNTPISLGTNWKEAIVHVYYSGYSDSRVILNHSDFNGAYSLGYYVATNNNWKCLVRYSNTTEQIYIDSSVFVGNDVTASTTIHVHIKN